MKNLILLFLLIITLFSCLEPESIEEEIAEIESTTEDILEPFGIGIHVEVYEKCINYFTFDDISGDGDYQSNETMLSNEATVCLTDLVEDIDLDAIQNLNLLYSITLIEEASSDCDSSSFIVNIAIDNDNDSEIQDSELVTTYIHCNTQSTAGPAN